MKKYLAAGLIILLPMALTLMVISFFFHLFATPFAKLSTQFVQFAIEHLSWPLSPKILWIASQIFAVLFLFVFLCLLGAITRWFLIKSIIKKANQIISKIPLIKTVYKISHDIIDAILSMDGKKAFKAPVAVPFPQTPSLALGFQAGELCAEIREKLKLPLVPVFAPTAPHPISGFLFFIPEKDVQLLPMNNEDAFKFLVSCGLIRPIHKKSL